MKIVVSVLAITLFGLPASAAVSCENLSSVSIPHTTVTSAQVIAAGAFTPPPTATRGGAGGGQPVTSPFADLPAFCRVMAVSKPTSDSEIKVEVWLPASNWNGEFRAAGFPGSLGGGGIGYVGLGAALRGGAVAGGSNSGHDGDINLMNHPERLADYAYRSLHEVAVTTKALTQSFYGKQPKLNVIADCGAASVPGLNDPARNPADFDAIAMGGYAAYFTHHIFGQMVPWVATHKDAGSYIPPEKFRMLHNAVMEQCDAQDDGARDGLIEFPPHCKFDPAVLQCKEGDAATCLTAPQVQAVRQIYTGPINPRTRQRIYEPHYPGSELTWGQNTGATPFFLQGPEGFRVEAYDFFRYLVFKDPNWTYKSRPINFDSDVALADSRENLVVDAIHNADLNKFVDRDGKLLLSGGWSNTGVPGAGIIEYYDAVVKNLGARKAKDSVRLFMIPGMGNCPGTNGEENFNFDGLKAIEVWKETGKAPEQLIVSRYKNGIEVGKRLVCPYPQIAKYKGTGSMDDASNYMCQEGVTNVNH
jgi:tannase/feruloyl esterase